MRKRVRKNSEGKRQGKRELEGSETEPRGQREWQ